MHYEKSLALHGNETDAIDLASATFASCGLQVTARSATTIDAAGRPPAVRDAGGSMIGAASRAHVRVGGGHVTLRAEFSRLRRLSLILAGVMAGIALLLLGGSSALAALGVIPGYGVALAVLPLTPFVIIVPLLLSHFRRRAAAELDAFLRNLTMAGPRDASPSAA